MFPGRRSRCTKAWRRDAQEESWESAAWLEECTRDEGRGPGVRSVGTWGWGAVPGCGHGSLPLSKAVSFVRSSLHPRPEKSRSWGRGSGVGVQPLCPACPWGWEGRGYRPWHQVRGPPGAATLHPNLLREQLRQAQCPPSDPCLPAGATDELGQLPPPGDVELRLSAG